MFSYQFGREYPFFLTGGIAALSPKHKATLACMLQHGRYEKQRVRFHAARFDSTTALMSAPCIGSTLFNGRASLRNDAGLPGHLAPNSGVLLQKGFRFPRCAPRLCAVSAPYQRCSTGSSRPWNRKIDPDRIIILQRHPLRKYPCGLMRQTDAHSYHKCSHQGSWEKCRPLKCRCKQCSCQNPMQACHLTGV